MKNRNGSTPTAVDPAQVLAEASSIERGEKPHLVLNQPAVSGPATGNEAEGAATPQGDAAPTSLSLDRYAELAIMLCDWPFVRMFGVEARLPDPFRDEAKKAWLEVLKLYLPAQVQQAGPLGVLASIYLGHVGALIVLCQMNAPSSPSSGNAGPGSPV